MSSLDNEHNPDSTVLTREASARQETVLVVDDTPDNITLMSSLLKDLYKVKIANNGEKALQIAAADNPPDLILLDIMMPRMDGYEVCQRLRSDALLKDVRIIMLTAKGREVEREKGLALGADLYITKPFSTRQVVMKVKEILAAKSGP